MSGKLIRREELVTPGPVVRGLITSAKHEITIAWHRRAQLIEFDDALFRTNSAVMMPTGQRPNPAFEPGRQRTAVGLAATVLRVVEEHPGLKILVAGHADTKGGDRYNLELSEWRAQCVTTVLLGQSKRFAALCNDWKRMRVADYQQILKWIAETWDWDCDPGEIDDTHDNATQSAVNNFRKAYNADGPGASWAAKITPWGTANNDETWEAYFNCYEDALVEELGEGRSGLARLRQGLEFVVADHSVGCGEHHPKEADNVDEYQSQTNRRVEVLFFEPGEVPKMDCHQPRQPCDPTSCALYDSTRFSRRVLPPLLSALPWHARWDGDVARMDETRALVLNAPGLPAGETLTFTVTQEELGVVAEMTVTSGVGRAEVDFNDWEHPDSFEYAGDLGTDDAFVEVWYSFVVEGAGRRLAGGKILYRDDAALLLVLPDDTPFANQPVNVISPWGTRALVTDSEGVVRVTRLPPGGVSVVLRQRTLVHMGELPSDWYEDED